MESNNNSIFEFICDLITKEHFTQGQLDFYMKNCKIFSDEEENKHEYMKVYEEYVYIIDQAIDSQLISKFPQEEVDRFYKTFKDDYARYKEINQDSVEILNNSIDFEKFKQTMLRFKDGMINQKEEDRDQSKPNLGEAGEEKFYRLLSENHDSKYKWRKMIEIGDKKKNTYSGTIYQKPSDETPIDTLWSDLRMNNVTIDNFLDVFKDGPPMKMAKERKCFRRVSDTESYLRVLIKLPMLDMREQIIKRTISRQEDGSVIHIINSVLDDEYPIVDGVVRAQMFKVQKIQVAPDNANDIIITDIANVDMKGYFPSRMINMVMSTAMSKALPELYSEIKKTVVAA